MISEPLEVETTLRGIAPNISNQTVARVLIVSTVFVLYSLKERYKKSALQQNDCGADFLTQFVRAQDAKALPPP